MRKTVLLATFFIISPLLFVFTLILLLFETHHSGALFSSNKAYTRQVAFAALPTSENIFGDTVQPADARVEMLRQFFTKYHSPLTPFAEEFVTQAETYQLDFRLLPAIAMQETNLCLKSHEDSYNCWGFGVYGGKYMYFDNYPQAIETISKALALRYRDKHGLVTPEEIQHMYTPSNDGSWAYSVNHFMQTLQ
ncbi:hypothetical protein BH09PAT1_BH09PAT1_0970 [soil metagenome]